MRHRLAIPGWGVGPDRDTCMTIGGMNNGKWIYEFMMDDFEIFSISLLFILPPTATLACWLLYIFPEISIVEQLNDFHLFIIFGLSHYSIISIYLDGHPNYISIVVVRANGRQMEFPVITAICGRGVRDQHLSFVVLACLLGAATNLYDAKIRQTKSRIPRRP